MKNILLVSLVLTLALLACSKDKFTTEPKVEIKSISPGIVNSGNVIRLRSEYTDKEGDLDSAYIVYKWYNGTTAVRNDTFRYNFSMLNLPSDLKDAQLDVTFEYNTNNNQNMIPLPGVSLRDTTASFGLVLVDKAGHRSNYAESEKIRLKKP